MEGEDRTGTDHIDDPMPVSTVVPAPKKETLLDGLANKPQAYHIFHALRIIEAHYSDAPRLGESKRPSQDKVRLGQEAEMAFPPTTIRSFSMPQGDAPGKLINRAFGLFGTHGPLPLHLTEYARDRQRNHRDHTFVDFANLFTHRMLGLFYRAWSSAEPSPSFDREGNDPFEEKVAALAGHKGKQQQDRDSMPDLSKRYFAGFMASGPRHADGLMSIISAFFDSKVELQHFVGTWLKLDPDDRWALGASTGLGQGTSIGEKVWSRSSKFRLRIGPLKLADYERILPGGPSLKRLEAIVLNYMGDVFEWDVNLVLKADEVPKSVLGKTTRLGHTSWIGTRTSNEDADELYLDPRALSRPIEWA